MGAAAVWQRESEPDAAAEPLELMRRALAGAADDAGAPALLERADSVRVPRGFWDYPDPGRWLAEKLGAPAAHTVMADLGVLQTTLLGGAARDIAEGRCDVALVAGGEARHRDGLFRAAGRTAPLTALPAREADRVLRPAEPILSHLEIRSGLGRPVNQYALIENALRAAAGSSLEDHRREIAELWSGMSRVAAGNPDAWFREVVPADELAAFGPGNPLLAFPYGKRHASQWNVDQAAGLVLCSVATARALGIAADRWVFPLAVAESNTMRPLTERADLDRSPGFRLAGEKLVARTGVDLASVPHRELYSCFPSAVRVQQRELALRPDEPVTLTGGMGFAGGPLNNFVLQAAVALVRTLRAHPGEPGLLTAVSGMLTKQGAGLWSTEPGPGFHFDEVGEAAAAADPGREVALEGAGDATIASYTVLGGRGGAESAILVCDREDGRRQLATPGDPALLDAMLCEEFLGRAVRFDASGGCTVEGVRLTA
ncbi:MAG: acetyl-CoA acetyltransferase [Myxococcota bacterium]